MKINVQDAAKLIPQVAYKMGDVTYVPHYRNSSVYVGPGYPRFNKTRYSVEQLALAGAVAVHEFLWVRSNHGIVTDEKP